MSTPFKPWEGKDFSMNQNSSGVDPMPIFGGTLGSQSAEAPSTAGIVGPGIRPVVTAVGPSSTPPPLPNRNHQRSISQMQPYSRYPPNMYSNFGMGAYSPYSSYGGYGAYPRRVMGGYGMGYSGFGGYQDDFDASMMQAIDDSCQTLFGPFEALVRSIGSIAMVLDSTHQAMQFSFRTVLSAADSLSKLKSLIIDLASSFSVIRLIRSLYYKVLRLLGALCGRSMKEKEWSEVFNKASTSGAGATLTGTNAQPKPSPWLALGFFSLMMGGPYLMFRLFAHNIKNSPGKNDLKVGNDYIDAITAYDFDAATSQELSMKRGDRLKVSRTNGNQSWVLASNGVSTGFVPTNRLQLMQTRYKTRKTNMPTDQRIASMPQAETSSISGYLPPKNCNPVASVPMNGNNKMTNSENSSETN